MGHHAITDLTKGHMDWFFMIWFSFFLCNYYISNWIYKALIYFKISYFKHSRQLSYYFHIGGNPTMVRLIKYLLVLTVCQLLFMQVRFHLMLAAVPTAKRLPHGRHLFPGWASSEICYSCRSPHRHLSSTATMMTVVFYCVLHAGGSGGGILRQHMSHMISKAMGLRGEITYILVSSPSRWPCPFNLVAAS